MTESDNEALYCSGPSTYDEFGINEYRSSLEGVLVHSENVLT